MDEDEKVLFSEIQALARKCASKAFDATGGGLGCDDFCRLETLVMDYRDALFPPAKKAPEWSGGRYFGGEYVS